MAFQRNNTNGIDDIELEELLIETSAEDTFSSIMTELLRIRSELHNASDKQASALTTFLAILALERKVRKLSKKQSRRCWVGKHFQKREDKTANQSYYLNTDSILTDRASYEDFFGITKDMFTYLVQKTGPLIGKQDTVMRKCISVPEKLLATLRFLTTGSTYRTLQYSTMISKAALSLFIPFTCEAIYLVLKDDFIKVPQNTEDWLKISKDFEDLSTIPNCIGVLGGRHIQLKPPVQAQEFRYNEKYTIEFLSVIDSEKKFIAVDVIVDGAVEVETVFPQSVIDQSLKYNVWNFPSPTSLIDGNDVPVPYFVAADSSFPLGDNIMTPFNEKEKNSTSAHFNDKISHINQVLEDLFSYFGKRYRIFQVPIPLHPEKVKNIVLACCALHNFCKISGLKDEDLIKDVDGNIVSKGLTHICHQRSYRSVTTACAIRRQLSKYLENRKMQSE